MGFANSVSVLGFDLRAGESLVHFFPFQCSVNAPILKLDVSYDNLEYLKFN